MIACSSHSDCSYIQPPVGLLATFTQVSAGG